MSGIDFTGAVFGKEAPVTADVFGTAAMAASASAAKTAPKIFFIKNS
jgi:hypothetical protein